MYCENNGKVRVAAFCLYIYINLPHTTAYNYLTILSPEDLRLFGPNVKQIESPFHAVIEANGNIHKLITDSSEENSLSYVYLYTYTL